MSNETFSTTELANDRVLVNGHDASGTFNQVILDGAEFHALKRHEAASASLEDYDAAVEQFFAPLVSAAEAYEDSLKVVDDPAFYVVVSEGTEGTPARAEERRRLQQDTVVLRLIEQGNTGRLVWVNGAVEVLAQATPTAPVGPVAGLAELVEDEDPTEV